MFRKINVLKSSYLAKTNEKKKYTDEKKRKTRQKMLN